MSAQFPSSEWLQGLEEKLNSDEKYAQVAKKWEGDLIFLIEPEGNLEEQLTFYLDLWHGACRSVDYNPGLEKYSQSSFYVDRQLQQHHSHPDWKTGSDDCHDDQQIEGQGQPGIYDAQCAHRVGFCPLRARSHHGNSLSISQCSPFSKSI